MRMWLCVQAEGFPALERNMRHPGVVWLVLSIGTPSTKVATPAHFAGRFDDCGNLCPKRSDS